MCCELWIDVVGIVDQFVCIGDIVDIGGDFVGEQWEIWVVIDLCLFDFVVLICVFDQLYYDVVVQLICCLIQLVDGLIGMFVVSLYYDVKVVLICQ